MRAHTQNRRYQHTTKEVVPLNPEFSILRSKDESAEVKWLVEGIVSSIRDYQPHTRVDNVTSNGAERFAV